MIEKVKKYLKSYIKFVEETESNFNAWKTLNLKKDEYISSFVEKRFNKKFRESKDVYYISYTIENSTLIKVWYGNEKKDNSYHFLIELI